jgi:ankyrin repeat protein
VRVVVLNHARGQHPAFARAREMLLLEAARQGAHEQVRQLLQGGANINGVDRDGATALAVAASRSDLHMVKLLLEQVGVDVNKPNSLGMSPLMKASELCDAAVVHALLRARGVDVNAARPDGSTALICACSDDIPRSGSTSGALETVRALLAVPCINADAATGATAPVPGLTALMCAASRGDAAIVDALLHVPDILVSARSWLGHSALRLAMQNRHKEAASLL